MMSADTSTATIPNATFSTVPDYWPDFGPLQYVEVIFLTIITVLGTFGNLIVIFSIALERRVHAHGNIFIINLAIADLIVSAMIVPTVIANVIKTENALGNVFCGVIGFLVTATCTCSLCNLMFIAINRYWAVVRSSTYPKMFSKNRVYSMVAFTWIWSVAVVSPTLYGWGGLRFDAKMMVCSWDDVIDRGYTWFITVVAIFIPLSIIAFGYFKLFSTVRGSGRWVRSLSVGSGIAQNNDQHRRSMRKERSLLRTLLTTVLLFCACWLPFGGCVLIDPVRTPAHAKKVFGWLALTNSCLNFIIYGVMNPVFRRGYHHLFLFVFRCKRMQRISSTMLHGSFSDSFKFNKRTKADGASNGKRKTSKSDSNKENSRVDTAAGVPLGVSQTTQTTMSANSPLVIRSSKPRTNEPSPLAREERNKASPPTTNTYFKKGFVESIRRASLMRKKGRPRFTSDSASREEDRIWRAKRNSAMLLQIQMDGDGSNSDDEFAVNQRERQSRRTFSDVTPDRRNRNTSEDETQHGNENSNNKTPEETKKFILDVDEIAKGSLKGKWMPDNAVYSSRRNTPILERSLTDKELERKNSSPKTKIEVNTVSGELDDRELSPEEIALHELDDVLPPISPDASYTRLGSLAPSPDQENSKIVETSLTYPPKERAFDLIEQEHYER